MPLRFAHPEPSRAGSRTRPKVFPVFLPLAGCPGRCVYCNQPAQTGRAPEPLDSILARARAELLALQQPVELAFYGGTFTALPPPWPERFLALARKLKACGRVTRVRCSTRPDAVTPALLGELRALGLDLLELGVQSFQDAALAASGRGYDGAAALAACRMVRGAGLGLGIQLLPGMPGHTRKDFSRDITTVAELAPELVRLYPCLVLEGTELTDLWRAGSYAPWTLDAAVDVLAEALRVLWAAGIPAARVGLAEQEGLAILAGPRHPALGQMARARALFLHVRSLLPALPAPPATLFVPARWQGEVLGQGNALAAEYAGLGLGVEVWGEEEFGLG